MLCHPMPPRAAPKCMHCHPMPPRCDRGRARRVATVREALAGARHEVKAALHETVEQVERAQAEVRGHAETEGR
eukprot:4734099-Prymnesium_polylepis.1